jgi:hypothetical protein
MVGSTPPRFESVEAMDRELACLARSGGALRCKLGAGLEALARCSGHHELGFSSLESYALERCERSARWVQESRAIARRLEELPCLRRALLTGEVSFSMAQVVGKVARAENERAWLAELEVRTVREMQQLVRGRAAPTSTASEDDGSLANDGPGDELSASDEELTTLTVTVDREDAWLFECARMIGRQPLCVVSSGRHPRRTAACDAAEHPTGCESTGFSRRCGVPEEGHRLVDRTDGAHSSSGQAARRLPASLVPQRRPSIRDSAASQTAAKSEGLSWWRLPCPPVQRNRSWAGSPFVLGRAPRLAYETG